MGGGAGTIPWQLHDIMASVSACLTKPPIITIRVVTLARVLRITSSVFITIYCARMFHPEGIVGADLTVNCSQAA